MVTGSKTNYVSIDTKGSVDTYGSRGSLPIVSIYSVN